MKTLTICFQGPGEECLLPEEVVAYVQRILSSAEEARAEKHLQTCNACLNEVREAFRIASFLASSSREPVPTALKARVRSLWLEAKERGRMRSDHEEVATGEEGKEKGPTS